MTWHCSKTTTPAALVRNSIFGVKTRQENKALTPTRTHVKRLIHNRQRYEHQPPPWPFCDGCGAAIEQTNTPKNARTGPYVADFHTSADGIIRHCSRGGRGVNRGCTHVYGLFRAGFCTEFLKIWHRASETGGVVNRQTGVENYTPYPLRGGRQARGPSCSRGDGGGSRFPFVDEITPVSGPQILGRINTYAEPFGTFYGLISGV